MSEELLVDVIWQLAAAESRLSHCHWGGGESHLGPWSPDPFESVLFCDNGDVFSPVNVGSCGISPSFIRFFCFIRRFWNQIFTWKGFTWEGDPSCRRQGIWELCCLVAFQLLTWVSLSCSAAAISILLARVRYLLKWNSFSSSVSCFVEKLVLPVLLIPPPCPPK